MNKNYVIIGLIVLSLITIALIAKMPPQEVNDGGIPFPRGGQTAQQTPHLVIPDQTVASNNVIVDSVYTEVDSWISIHPLNENTEPIIDTVIGLVRIESGLSQNIALSLEEDIEDGIYFALLSADEGEIGVFEQSSEDALTDPPIFHEGSNIHTFFTLTAYIVDSEEESEEFSEEVDEEEAPTEILEVELDIESTL